MDKPKNDEDPGAFYSTLSCRAIRTAVGDVEHIPSAAERWRFFCAIDALLFSTFASYEVFPANTPDSLDRGEIRATFRTQDPKTGEWSPEVEVLYTKYSVEVHERWRAPSPTGF